MTWPNISYLHRYADVGKGLPTKRGGVCNPAANVLCEITASDIPQNVSDGITNHVRLRKLSIKSALEGTPSPSLAFALDGMFFIEYHLNGRVAPDQLVGFFGFSPHPKLL